MAQLKRLIVQLLVFVSVVVVTSLAEAKVPPEAEEHMEAGLAYFDDPSGPRYEEAYREFHKAYDIHPAYQLLANIGTCALYLERDAEAIDAYQRYLREAKAKDIPPKKRVLMEKDIKTLTASLVRLSIHVTPAKVTLIDERFTSKGQSVVNRYEVADGNVSLGIHPGNHRITAHREGFEDQRWELDAKPASSHSHEFNLVAQAAAAPVPPVDESKADAAKHATSDEASPDADRKARGKRRPTPTSVYVGLGVTGVFAVAAAVGGFLTLSKRSDYIEANDGKHLEQAEALHTDLSRYMVASGIAGGATIVAAGVTTYLYLSRPEEADESRKKQATWRIVPVVGVDRAGLSVSGGF